MVLGKTSPRGKSKALEAANCEANRRHRCQHPIVQVSNDRVIKPAPAPTRPLAHTIRATNCVVLTSWADCTHTLVLRIVLIVLIVVIVVIVHLWVCVCQWWCWIADWLLRSSVRCSPNRSVPKCGSVFSAPDRTQCAKWTESVVVSDLC